MKRCEPTHLLERAREQRLDTNGFLRRQNIILNIKDLGEQIQESSILCHAKYFTLRNCSTMSQNGHLMHKQAACHLSVRQADHRISGFCKHRAHISRPKNQKILRDSNSTSVFSRRTTNKPNNRMHPPLKSLPPSSFLPLSFLPCFASLFSFSSPHLLHNTGLQSARPPCTRAHTQLYAGLSHSNKWSLFAGAHG